MKEQFINKLVGQPWAIHRQRGKALIARMVHRLRGDRPAEDDFGEPLPKMQIVGDVAIIPIVGTVALGLPDWVKKWGLGLTDVNDVEEEIALAMSDTRVAMIVLDFDSPGGWSIAGQKLFNIVEKAQAGANAKPLFAWCGDGREVCSAAFHGATPARLFFVAPYSLAVGCIGTYQTLMDDTEFWRMMGISVEVLRSGDLKGMGLDGYSKEQRDWLQSICDQAGALFRKHVGAYRSTLDPAEMQGQFYDGTEAARLGFAHGLARDLPAAIKKFRSQLG